MWLCNLRYRKSANGEVSTANLPINNWSVRTRTWIIVGIHFFGRFLFNSLRIVCCYSWKLVVYCFSKIKLKKYWNNWRLKRRVMFYRLLSYEDNKHVIRRHNISFWDPKDLGFYSQVFQSHKIISIKMLS